MRPTHLNVEAHNSSLKRMSCILDYRLLLNNARGLIKTSSTTINPNNMDPMRHSAVSLTNKNIFYSNFIRRVDTRWSNRQLNMSLRLLLPFVFRHLLNVLCCQMENIPTELNISSKSKVKKKINFKIVITVGYCKQILPTNIPYYRGIVTVQRQGVLDVMRE